MPRKKKTKEQKKRADVRKSAAIATPSTSHVHDAHEGHIHATPTYTFSTLSHAVERLQNRPHLTDTIALVQKDVRTTAIVSTLILATQLILYFLLKNHVLAIGFVSY